MARFPTTGASHHHLVHRATAAIGLALILVGGAGFVVALNRAWTDRSSMALAVPAVALALTGTIVLWAAGRARRRRWERRAERGPHT